MGSGAGVARGPHPLWSRLRGPRFPRRAGDSEPGRSHVPHKLNFHPHPTGAGGLRAPGGARAPSRDSVPHSSLLCAAACGPGSRVWAAAKARRRGFPTGYRAAAHLRALASCGFQVSPCAPLRSAPTVSVFPLLPLDSASQLPGHLPPESALGSDRVGSAWASRLSPAHLLFPGHRGQVSTAWAAQRQDSGQQRLYAEMPAPVTSWAPGSGMREP